MFTIYQLVKMLFGKKQQNGKQKTNKRINRKL